MKRYARAAGVVGFVGALVVGGVATSGVGGDDAAVSASCKPGQVQTFSKYAGTVCIGTGGKVGKAITQFSVGCALGIPGGVTGIAYGCAGGLASVIIDNRE